MCLLGRVHGKNHFLKQKYLRSYQLWHAYSKSGSQLNLGMSNYNSNLKAESKKVILFFIIRLIFILMWTLHEKSTIVLINE